MLIQQLGSNVIFLTIYRIVRYNIDGTTSSTEVSQKQRMAEGEYSKIGRYEIEREIGRGGMAIVYKAHDAELDRYVAIKLIRKAAFTGDQLATLPERFRREARALAKLDHPNIVKVLDYGEIDGSNYLVMEFLEGATLKEIRKPLRVETAVKLIRPIAEALDYVHQRGLLHRDVKPSNLMFTAEKRVMLTDFGIAKWIDDDENRHTLTVEGMGIGTPEYMAPEQGMGKKIDARADMYSLAIIFYELITGKKPFRGETQIEILTKQATEPFPDPREYVPELNKSVTRFFETALAKKPDDRYSTMQDFLRDLDGLRLQSLAQAPSGNTAMMTAPSSDSDVSNSSVQIGPTKIQKVRQAAEAYVQEGAKVSKDTKSDATRDTESKSELKAESGAKSTESAPPSRAWTGKAVRYAIIGVILTIAAIILSNGFFKTKPTPEPKAPTGTKPVMSANATVSMKKPTQKANPSATPDVTVLSAEQQQLNMELTVVAVESLKMSLAQTQNAMTEEAAAKSREKTEAAALIPTSTPALPPATATAKPQPTEEEEIRVGSVLTFGATDQDNNPDNGAEAIQWRVLELSGRDALVISEKIIAAQPFSNANSSVWGDSPIREWLNTEFLNTTFTQAEIRQIQYVTHQDDDQNHKRNVEDQVFLLNVEEVLQYLPRREDQATGPTDTVTAFMMEKQRRDVKGWWLRRTPKFDNSDQTVTGFWSGFMVGVRGDIIGNFVANYDGVRPTLQIRLPLP